MNRQQRREIAEDTVEILERGFYENSAGDRVDIGEWIERVRANTEDYPPEFDIDIPEGTEGMPTIDIEVTNETTIAACRRLADDGIEPMALNFASATSPGGGFLSGASAQEESLARASGLYASLLESEMYSYQKQRDMPMYADWTIYSPEVPVFRRDDGSLLDEPFSTTFVTSPAVNVDRVRRNAPAREDEVEAVMDERIDRVLGIALEHGHNHLVLGAWGCGIFRNDPQVISELFREALDGPFRGRFDSIVFAIAAKPGEPNLQAFKERFAGG